jgi:hypothetical protein
VFGDEHSALTTPVGETRIDDTSAGVVGSHGPIERRTTSDEHIDQGFLHAHPHRVNTRRDEPQRCRASIHIADGVNVCTGIEQHLGDLDRVPGSALSISLDAVRADVEQQRRVMCAPRARCDDLRILPQHSFERVEVAADDRIDGEFKLRDERIGVAQRFSESHEPIPGLEVLLRGNNRAGSVHPIFRTAIAHAVAPQIADPRQIRRPGEHRPVLADQRLQRCSITV